VREIETRVLDYEASRLDAILSEWIGGFAARAAWTATGHQEVRVQKCDHPPLDYHTLARASS
jgi:hypothetical protein